MVIIAPRCVEQDPLLLVTYGGVWPVSDAWCAPCRDKGGDLTRAGASYTRPQSSVTLALTPARLPHWHSSAAARLLPAAIRYSFIPETRRGQRDKAESRDPPLPLAPGPVE